MTDKNRVYIFDTTMRDGEQSPGASMSLEEKLNIANLFDQIGIDIIEAGFPAASKGDFEAVSEVSKILKTSIPCGLSRHIKKDIDACNESLKFAESLLSLGAYFSASGIITFKNSLELQNTFKFIPLDKILIETDSPYLAPVPNRGKQNEPSFVKYTAEKLAEIKQISNLEIIENTTANFNYLFN